MDALRDVRGISNELQEEYPSASLGGTAIGATLMALATKDIKPLAYLCGASGPATLTKAQHYARALTQGGILGSLFNIGESDIEGVEPESSPNENERVSKLLMDIIKGAGFGAAGGALGTAAADVGSNLLRRFLGTNLSPAQKTVANTLKDQSDESLLDAAEGITRANVQGQPLLLPEVLENNQLLDDAASIRAIAPNRQDVENFLTDRAEQASNRISNKLTQELGVEPMTPIEGGKRLKEGFENIITEAEAARRAETAPLYQRSAELDPLADKQAFGEFFNAPEGQALERKALETRTTFNRPVEEGKVDPVVLNRINELLNDRQQATLVKEAGSREADLGILKSELSKGIDEAVPNLSAANKRYRELSQPINELKETALGKIIKNVDDVNANKALVIFENQPENILKAKEVFEKAGKSQDFQIAARSYLEDLINKQSATGGKKAAKAMLKNQNTIERLKAAIGDDQTYSNISDFLGREAKMENFPLGSPTASRGVLYKKLGVTPESSSEAVTTMGLLNRELKDSGGILGVARAALGLERRPNEKMIRELADMLLTPEGGTQSIEAILRNRNDRLSGTVGEALRAGIMSGSRMPSTQEDLQYQLMEALRR